MSQEVGSSVQAQPPILTVNMNSNVSQEVGSSVQAPTPVLTTDMDSNAPEVGSRVEASTDVDSNASEDGSRVQASTSVYNQVGYGRKRRQPSISANYLKTCNGRVRAAARRALFLSQVKAQYKIEPDPESFDVNLLDMRVQTTYGPEFVECYEQNFSSIRTKHMVACRFKDVFNFRVENADAIFENLPLQKVFFHYKCHFKVSASVGWIMEDVESGEFRYFHSSVVNLKQIESKNLITNEMEYLRFLDDFKSIDLYEQLDRPNYRWQIRMITNVTLAVYKFENMKNINKIPIYGKFLCGCDLPEVVENKKSLVSFSKYKDGLCFFRCLAYAASKRCDRLERLTKSLYRKFCDHFPPNVSVTLELIPKLEELFQVCLTIHESADMGAMTIYSHPNIKNFPKVALDICFCPNHRDSAHFSYISSWTSYSKSGFICNGCGAVFMKKANMNNHRLKSCRTATKEVYVGNVFSPSKSVFSTLESDYNIKLSDMPKYPYFSVYDFEAGLFAKDSSTQNTKYNKIHVPISFSIFSNVPGYDSQPFTKVSTGNVKLLMEDFVNYLNSVSDRAYSELKAKYQYIYDFVEKQVREDEVEKMLKKLDKYFRVLPVISFNGSRYDLNLIKKFVFPYMDITSCIKRGNSYLSLRTPKLQMLDILNYLQAGTSYRQFLEAFQCEEQKGFFPYEYLDRFEVLNETELPKQEAFFDTLNGRGISDSDYAKCVNVWNSHSMTTMSDYLKHYNESDVIGFRTAVQKMLDLYFQKGVSLFKDAISLPGVSLFLLFKDVKDPFVCAKNPQQHDIISRGIIGGLSVIMKRFAQQNVTYIKPQKYGDSEICASIIGLDCNSLYPFTMSGYSPSGVFSHRVLNPFCKDQLVPVTKLGYTQELRWLLVLEQEKGISIQTSLSQNGQKRVNQRYYVDGYFFDERTGISHLYDYYGCFYHKCPTCGYADDRGTYAKTMERERELRELPNTQVHILWEHDLKKFLKAPSDEYPGLTRQQLLEREVPRTLLENKPISVKSLLSKIRTETIFGLVVCSVRIKPSFHAYYDEFPPLCENMTIGQDDLQGIMRDFAKENGLLTKPTKLLVAKLSVKNGVFITPQIQWFYLENDKHKEEVFIIEDVTDFLEFNPKKSFSKFVKEGIKDRIAGDFDPDKKILSYISKTVLNSAYGKTLINKNKQRKVTIAKTTEKVYKLMNSPFFTDLDELGDGVYEVTQRHKTIRWDMARQIGVFVYGMAKLHMLKFVYNFLKKYLEDHMFECLSSDTDSIYLAISSQSIDQCVKPHLKAEFEKCKYEWLVDPKKPGDNRRGGAYKVEYQGTAFVGLNSKTYACLGKEKKFGCKGVNRKQNMLTFNHYKDVLMTKKTHFIENRGMKLYGNSMHSYIQRKPGLSYLYAKRVVADDGIHTSSLK